MVVRLPEEKLRHTLAMVQEWMGKKACRKRELESLLGHLQHAATVVRPGRTFVRRLIELLSTVQTRDRWIRLNASTRSDLMWWLLFTEGWNGVSMMPKPVMPVIHLETDASGTWGCGARWGAWWLQWEWVGPTPSWPISANLGQFHPISPKELLPISPKELLPILFAVAVWGAHWAGRRVECHCDNMAVVNSGRSQDNTIMHLLRCLFFLAAHFHVQIRVTHIPGVDNVAADALSRNDLPRFMQVVPDAAHDPSPISQRLVDLLVGEQLDWTSLHWAQQFRDFCRQAWHHQCSGPTWQARSNT